MVGYIIGIMEKKMETTILGLVGLRDADPLMAGQGHELGVTHGAQYGSATEYTCNHTRGIVLVLRLI